MRGFEEKNGKRKELRSFEKAGEPYQNNQSQYTKKLY